jgi:hypothetical protein
VFKGKLDDNISRATFSFTTIFGPGGGALTVNGLQLKETALS